MAWFMWFVLFGRRLYPKSCRIPAAQLEGRGGHKPGRIGCTGCKVRIPSTACFAEGFWEFFLLGPGQRKTTSSGSSVKLSSLQRVSYLRWRSSQNRPKSLA